MKYLGFVAIGVMALGVSATAQAAPATTRVRGTIESVKGTGLAIKTYDGKTVDVMLDASTIYTWVLPSSLSAIGKGDFIGTATQGSTNDMVAQEVVIFPETLRGFGEGNYPWSMPAAVASADASHGGSAGQTASTGPDIEGTMTNGTVAAESSGSAGDEGMVKGTMTNGTVAADNGASGAKTLSVLYKGGKVKITVPPDVPIVKLAKAEKSAVTSGEKAFVVATQPTDGSPGTAVFVAVGKDGLMPPM